MGSPVEISAIMAAYNAERYVLQSVQSVLTQTFPNFELIVVDDGSTDSTCDAVAALHDPRIRLLRHSTNLGVVAARNYAVASARGRYCAIIDADDMCHATRFARQKAHLDADPGLLLLGSAMTVLEKGRMTTGRDFGNADPAVLGWMLHHGNPLGHSSMMFRTDVVQRLGEYLREDMKYAEDFDFSHRVMRLGEISVLPERLIIYRLHDQNLTRTRRAEMIARTAAVLAASYEAIGDPNPRDAATGVAQHLAAGDPVTSGPAVVHLARNLDHLLAAFLSSRPLSAAQVNLIRRDAARAWWRCIMNSVGNGSLTPSYAQVYAFSAAAAATPPMAKLARSFAAGALPAKSLVQRLRAAAKPHRRPAAARVLPNGMELVQAPTAMDDAPRLYVAIDAEAEFDWSQPFNRQMTDVRAMGFQGPAQDIFGAFGIRPIYLVDYAVASQPEGYEPVKAFHARRQCVVGAHLHTWITPPFEEALSAANSYGCNLPPDLEYRKLEVLKGAVENSFGVSPLFFKAGRYGVGRNTLDVLSRLGFQVDLSIMPGTSYRRSGGPDFVLADATPYRNGADAVLSVPMTRGQIGLLPEVAPFLGRPFMASGAGDTMRGVLARLGLVNTVTLTPEGITADEQIALLKSMLRRGYRTFVLHYHSPSLMPGCTPYVRNDRDLAEFLGRLEAVCAFFTREIGGLAASPADLLPPHLRHLLWRDEPAQAPDFSGMIGALARTAEARGLPQAVGVAIS